MFWFGKASRLYPHGERCTPRCDSAIGLEERAIFLPSVAGVVLQGHLVFTFSTDEVSRLRTIHFIDADLHIVDNWHQSIDAPRPTVNDGLWIVGAGHTAIDRSRSIPNFPHKLRISHPSLLLSHVF